MTEGNISQTQTSKYDASIGSHQIDSAVTDAPQAQKETEWRNPDWEEQLGLYKNNRGIRNVVDALARWTIGKGWKTAIPNDNVTETVLNNFRGNGKETFNSILKNLKKVSDISGDAFAEIVRNKSIKARIKKALTLQDYIPLNLKPLDPGIVGIVQNRKGIITHYKIYHKSNPKKFSHKIMPEDMFHLSRNRIADEIHGTSLLDILKWVATAKEEAERDWRKVLRRNVMPIRIWKLKTDKTSKISAFIANVKAAKEDFEDIFIPMDSVETEVSAVAPNQTLDAKQWIKDLSNEFHEAGGVPKIIVGNSSEFTEAAGKIVYLSFEQTVEEGQLEIEEQISMQLGFDINLEFPASLRNEILTGQSKSETMQASTPEDTSVGTAGTGGQT